MRRAAIALVLGIPACGGGGSWAETEGAIGGHDFGDVQTVLHGQPFIVLFDREISCEEAWWVSKGYTDGQSPDDSIDYVGLQFAFDGDNSEVGTFSVAGDSQVSSFGLVNISGVFERFYGRDGTLTVTDVSEKSIVGSFEVGFTDSGVIGEFESEYCRNLKN